MALALFIFFTFVGAIQEVLIVSPSTESHTAAFQSKNANKITDVIQQVISSHSHQDLIWTVGPFPLTPKTNSFVQFNLFLHDTSLPWHPNPQPSSFLSTEQERDSFHLKIEGNCVSITALGIRGLLYGFSEALKNHLTFHPRLGLTTHLHEEVQFPSYPLRGHQIGYNALDNTYDAWNITQMDRYLTELMLFKTNMIEIHAFDGVISPHFQIPVPEMNHVISTLCDLYDLNVSLYYSPSSSPNWGSAWEGLPRLNRLFVPGGDGGSINHPKPLFEFISKWADKLFHDHPDCEIWISHQTWLAPTLDEFYEILNTDPPKWLTGIIYGPHTAETIYQTRARTPKKYPVAHYPDVAHQLKSEFPQPSWTWPFAFTEARESINPRVHQMVSVFKNTQTPSIGFCAYNEGVTADTNIMLWSALAWNDALQAQQFLLDYAKFFMPGDSQSEHKVARLGSRLESNWHGMPGQSSNIQETLKLALQIVGSTPVDQFRRNWRLQGWLFRAYFDAYEELRFTRTEKYEADALAELKKANTVGVPEAIKRAKVLLELGESVHVEPLSSWRKEIFELGELIYKTIGTQMSVPLYQAESIGRGACLDTIDVPLGNIRYLNTQFTKILSITNQTERLNLLHQLIDWENPGKDGYYDDLGDIRKQPHLVPGLGPAADPSCYNSSLSSFKEPFNISTVPILPKTWYTWAEAFYDSPLEMFYPKLHARNNYSVVVVYPTEMQAVIKLEARYSTDTEFFVVHDFMKKPNPIVKSKFDLPASTKTKGDFGMTLRWSSKGYGGNGRGTQVAEVWLRTR